MKQNNQERVDGNRPVRPQSGASERPTGQDGSGIGSRLSSIPQAIGSRLSQLVSRVRENVSRRNAMMRARLENDPLPDDRSVRRGSAPGVSGRGAEAADSNLPMRDPEPAVHADAAMDQTRRLPLRSESLSTTAPDSASAAAGVTSGTYIDLTAPNPMAGAAGVRRTNAYTEDAPVDSGEISFMEAVGSTMRAYRKRRAADRSIRRDSRERVYRLKGYTTVTKVNRKYASERRQRLLRRILTFIIVILTVVLLIQLYNPITDLSEWYRILGVDSLDDLPNAQNTTITGGSGPVTITPPATSASTGSTTRAGTSATTRTTTRATTR